MARHSILLTLLFVLSSSYCIASDGTWHNFSNGNYIIDLVAYNDEIWCATVGGVVQWNTRNMTSELFNVIDGLPDNRMTSIAVDSTGTVWAGTERGGICCYDGVQWEVYGNSDGLDDLRITDVAVSSDNEVYITTHLGIYKFNGSDWSRVTSAYQSKWYYSITAAPDGGIWAGYEGGVDHIADSRITTHVLTELMPNATVRYILVDGNDIWCGSNYGLVRYHENQWTSLAGSGVGSLEIHGMAKGPDGAIWFATVPHIHSGGGGLSRFDGTMWSIYHNDIDKYSSLTIDTDNVVWTGYAYEGNEGLQQFTVTDEKWNLYPERTEGALLGNTITSINQTPDDDVFVGTQYGLSRLHGNEWSVVFENESSGPLMLSPNGTLYIGGITDGLYRLGDHGRELIEGFNGSYVTSMAFEDDTTFWVGTSNDGGLYHYKNGLWIKHDEQNGLPSGRINTVAVGPDGSVWAGTAAGLARYKDNAWMIYTADKLGIPEYVNDRESYIVSSLKVDRTGTVFVGTPRGLYAISDEQGVVCFEEEVKVLEVDSHGRLWFVREKVTPYGRDDCFGIYVGNEVIVEYVVPYGPQLLNINCLFIGSDDTVWIGTNENGLFSFKSSVISSVEVSDSKPPAFILGDNYPNPFNMSTTIPYTVLHDGPIELSIYTITGQIIYRYSGQASAGYHTFKWDGLDQTGKPVSSGVYVYSLSTGGSMPIVRKMVLYK